MILFILILVAFLVFFKLFKEFGKTQKIIIDMSEEDKNKLANMIDSIIAKQSDKSSYSSDMRRASALDKEIISLQEKFSDFAPTTFLTKAEEMFDAIFNAFANSHHYLLKSMLTEKLYESFAAQMERRQAKDLHQELLIKHTETSLDKIEILQEKAQILVTFDVSQMSAMVNNEGVSFDNPKRLYREIIYKWLFERNFNKENWRLSKIILGTSKDSSFEEDGETGNKLDEVREQSE